MRNAIRLLPLVLGFVAGCDSEEQPATETPRPSVRSAPSRFDADRCGMIAGRVTWNGPPPEAAPFIYGFPKPDGNFDIRTIPNPNCPVIDTKTRGVAGAVVFLRGIEPDRARPWNPPPARVEMIDRDIRIVQGERRSRVGFVRRGEAVEMVSREAVYHVLRARGAAFFSLPFPDPDQPLKRALGKAGIVTLSSGAGYYWAHANLFVADHPYYTVADGEGRFRFDQVPAGPVEVVAWQPGWTPLKKDRNPETGLIDRLTYSPPIETSVPVKVVAKQVAEASPAFNAATSKR